MPLFHYNVTHIQAAPMRCYCPINSINLDYHTQLLGALVQPQALMLCRVNRGR